MMAVVALDKTFPGKPTAIAAAALLCLGVLAGCDTNATPTPTRDTGPIVQRDLAVDINAGKSDSCTVTGGAGVTITPKRTMLFKGFMLAGDLQSTEIVCTMPDGRKKATRDHLALLTPMRRVQVLTISLPRDPEGLTGGSSAVVYQDNRSWQVNGTVHFAWVR